jgi:hypothetical protein
VFNPEVASLKAKIDELDGKLSNVSSTVVQDAQSRMLSDLDRQLPEWRQLNTDPDFVNWLQLEDSYSGVMRHILLKQAYERNQTPRVLAFFKGFLAEEAALDPADSPAPSPGSPAQGSDQGSKVPLETLAAPGRAKVAAGGDAPAAKPTYTRAFISKFYSELAAGKWVGREKQSAELEQRIFAAQREGRIVN